MSLFRYIYLKYGGYIGLFVVFAFIAVLYIGVLFLFGERLFGFDSLEAIGMAFGGLVASFFTMRALDKVKIRDDVERSVMQKKLNRNR